MSQGAKKYRATVSLEIEADDATIRAGLMGFVAGHQANNLANGLEGQDDDPMLAANFASFPGPVQPLLWQFLCALQLNRQIEHWMPGATVEGGMDWKIDPVKVEAGQLAQSPGATDPAAEEAEGTYRVEVTFKVADAELNDLVVRSTPDWPPGRQADLVSSALSLDNRHKVHSLVSRRLSTELGTWPNCPIRLVDEGLQVVDLADPEAPPMPGIK